MLRAEGFLALPVVALNPVARAVVEELGFALLRLAEGLVGDEDTTPTITCNPGESPTLQLIAFLVVGVLVAECEFLEIEVFAAVAILVS